MPCRQLERTAVSVSRVFRHFGAEDHTDGRVYRRNTCVCEHGRPCGQCTKMAIHMAGHVG